jgi:mRNA interferase MazF
MSFEYKKGDIVWVKIGAETRGSEQKNNRPAVIVQNNASNRALRTTLVAPITKATNIKKLAPTHAFLEKGCGGIDKDSVILCDQIRVVDKQERVLSRMGHLPKDVIQQINSTIEITFDLDNRFD